MEEVLEDLEVGTYERKTMEQEGKERQNLNMLSRGEFVEAKFIRFEDVPIVSPTGDVLVDKLNFTVQFL